MKRLFAMLLCLVMVLSLLPSAVFAGAEEAAQTMTPEEAASAAEASGLRLSVTGNTDSSCNLRVQLQDLPAGTAVEPGSTVTITLTDPTASD